MEPSKETMKLVRKFNKLYPEKFPTRPLKIFYASLWRSFELSHSNTYYKHIFKEVIEPLQDLTEVVFDYSLSTENNTSIGTDSDFTEAIRRANKKLRKLKPTHIRVKKSKKYICLEDLEVSGGFKLAKGSIFKIMRTKYSKRPNYKIKFISGKLTSTAHSSFFGSDIDYKGNQEFLSREELAARLNIDIDSFKIGFYPGNIGNYLPIEEVA